MPAGRIKADRLFAVRHSRWIEGDHVRRFAGNRGPDAHERVVVRDGGSEIRRGVRPHPDTSGPESLLVHAPTRGWR